MKDIRPALYAFLLADAAISGAVGAQRIYPVKLPQAELRPSVVYTRVSANGDHTMGGASGLVRARMQVDAWAQNANDAAALADLIKARLDGFRGTMPSASGDVAVQGTFFDGEREDYDGTAQLHRMSRDYVIFYEER